MTAIKIITIFLCLVAGIVAVYIGEEAKKKGNRMGIIPLIMAALFAVGAALISSSL